MTPEQPPTEEGQQTTSVDVDWKDKFEHWLIHNLQLTSKSNVQLIIDHVERYIAGAKWNQAKESGETVKGDDLEDKLCRMYDL